jgi:hypothetical protein
MKRFHLHVSVNNLEESVRFYSTLFATLPTVLRSDYAKWMLEDPRINFAISTHRQPVGVNHLGFQVDSGEELPSACCVPVAAKADAPCCSPAVASAQEVCCAT